MEPPTTLLLLLLFLAAAATFSTAARHLDGELPGRDFPGFGADPRGFFKPSDGGSFGIPGSGGWGNYGGGYGYGSGGPTGGSGSHGVVRPSVVCSEKGRCYMKKLTCPAKCFTSYSHSGKGYGGGGGGGGCTMDCKKCVAYC